MEEMQQGQIIRLQPGLKLMAINSLQTRLENYIAHLRYREDAGDVPLDSTGILSDIANELEDILRKESK